MITECLMRFLGGADTRNIIFCISEELFGQCCNDGIIDFDNGYLLRCICQIELCLILTVSFVVDTENTCC